MDIITRYLKYERECKSKRAAAPPRLRRGHSAEMNRGDAAVATWISRGDGSRRRRGCDVDNSWRRVAATLRPRRGSFAETSRGVRDDADIPSRPAHAPGTPRASSARRLRRIHHYASSTRTLKRSTSVGRRRATGSTTCRFCRTVRGRLWHMRRTASATGGRRKKILMCARRFSLRGPSPLAVSAGRARGAGTHIRIDPPTARLRGSPPLTRDGSHVEAIPTSRECPREAVRSTRRPCAGARRVGTRARRRRPPGRATPRAPGRRGATSASRRSSSRTRSSASRARRGPCL